jgi:adenosylcobyric acid synthase
MPSATASPRTNTLIYVGTSAKAGKTVFANGTARVLARSGLRVAPFKPVTVAKSQQVCDGLRLDVRSWRAGTAARSPVGYDNVPVQVVRRSIATGELWIRDEVLGTVPLLAEDTPLLDDLDGCLDRAVDAVRNAYDSLAARSDVVVAEGAGSCTDLAGRLDLANWYLPQQFGARSVLVAGGHAGGAIAGLRGTLAEMGAAARASLVGIALNDVRAGASLLERRARRLAQDFEVPYLGALPHCPIYIDIPAGWTSTLPDDEAEFDYLADFLTAHVDLPRLVSPAQDLSVVPA